MSGFSSKQLELRYALPRRHKVLQFGDKVMPDTENPVRQTEKSPNIVCAFLNASIGTPPSMVLILGCQLLTSCPHVMRVESPQKTSQFL